MIESNKQSSGVSRKKKELQHLLVAEVVKFEYMEFLKINYFFNSEKFSATLKGFFSILSFKDKKNSKQLKSRPKLGSY